jgi:hypothetical protein
VLLTRLLRQGTLPSSERALARSRVASPRAFR